MTKYFALQNTFTKQWVGGYGGYGSPDRPKLYDNQHIVPAIKYWGHGAVSAYAIERGMKVDTYPRYFDVHCFDEDLNKVAVMRADHFLMARGHPAQLCA